MKLQNNFTKMDGILQEHLNLWDNKIFPHLPQNTDELAAQTDTLQRKRGIRSAHALGISSVSDTAWRKRFSKSVPFLQEILHIMLSGLFWNTPDSMPTGIKNVLLVDASIVCQTGILQNQEQIHLCYSLNQNRVIQIKVTDHHTAEALSHFQLKKGDLDTGQWMFLGFASIKTEPDLYA